MNAAVNSYIEPIRLGVLVPSVNTIVEPEMYRMAPAGFSIHFSRLPVPSEDTSVENLSRLTDKLDESLQTLAQAKVEAVAFACTSGSFIKGTEWDRNLIQRMESVISPATTTSNAVDAALKKLDVRRLSLVTPYPQAINDLMTVYFEAQGYDIVDLKSLHLAGSTEIRNTSPGAIFNLAQSANTDQTEAVLISCTDFQAAPIIETLESKINKPVVTANQATLWRLLQLSGNMLPVKGYGTLFGS